MPGTGPGGTGPASVAFENGSDSKGRGAEVVHTNLEVAVPTAADATRAGSLPGQPGV
jgi:hypothetical protein